MNATVIWEYNTTTRTEHDDENGYFVDEKHSRKIEISTIPEADMYLQFADEDGDGDETGSWSRSILYILSSNGKVLYDSNKESDNRFCEPHDVYYRWFKSRSNQDAQTLCEVHESNLEVKKKLRQDYKERTIGWMKAFAESEKEKEVEA